MSELSSIVFGAILGSVISLLVTVLLENQRNPKFEFQIETPPYETSIQKKSARFLRVYICNKPLPKWLHWLSRGSATHCHGHIQFHHFSDGAPKFSTKMRIRWAGSGDPVSWTSKGNRVIPIVDPSKFDASYWREVHPGESELIDVVVRFSRERNCYGWTTESYLHKAKHPDFKLSRGRYLVVITVFSSGKTISECFQLENTAGYRDFRLLEASKSDRKKVRIK